MKKSKIMMISSLALAMVASLVMAFAMMNVTKAEPATVNATGDPASFIYFTDPGWSNVYAYVWTGETNTSIKLNKGGDRSLANARVYYYLDNSVSKWENIILRSAERWEDIARIDIDAISTEYSSVLYSGTSCVEYTPTTKTVYFKPTSTWTNVYAYVWKEGGVSFTDEIFDSDDDDWYELTCDEYYEKVIFKPNSNNWDGQTSNIVLNEDHPYIYGNDAYEFPVTGVSTPKDPGEDTTTYYLVGFINGKIGWGLTNDSIALGDPGESSNHAMSYNVFLHEGDVVKAWINNTSIGTDGYCGGYEANIEGGAVSVSADGENVEVRETGYYNVYVTSSDKLWLTKVVQHVKSKISTDGNWLLLITGFQMLDGDRDIEIGYEITLSKSGEDDVVLTAFDNKCYDAVNIEGSHGPIDITGVTLYGGSEGDFKLIVREINIEGYAGYTVTVTAKINYIGPAAEFDSSKTVSKVL